jgi:acetyl-CoA carboxylase biotin carboxylase subunit
VQGARHVEVQVLGWQHEGTSMAAALGERDCSVQRRHQKVAEESPSPGVGAPLRERMLSTAVRAVRDVGYTNAGTIECLIDPAAQEFFFLEMNTRLQVEHPVTEAVTGIDLVEQQLRIAGGLPPELPEVFVGGHAIELRVYAEDPVRFLPSPGTITAYSEPAGVRVDGAYRSGDTVTPHYDPMLAKVIVHGADREQALALARRAVADFTLQGIRNNLPFLAELLDDPRFVSGRYDTGLVELMRNPS